MVDPAKVDYHEPDGREGGGVLDESPFAQAGDPLLANDGPVAVGLSAVDAAVGGRVEGLDGVQDGGLEPVGIGVEEGLVEAEDAGVLWDGGGHAAGGVEGGSELGARVGADGRDAGEDLAEQAVGDVEGDGGADADLG